MHDACGYDAPGLAKWPRMKHERTMSGMKKRETPAQGLTEAKKLISDFFDERRDLAEAQPQFERACDTVLECFRNNGTLFLCGNGGSFADCLHISGELAKTFERKRPIPAAHAKALENEPSGDDLARELQLGFRAIPLGLSGSLVSAIWNDSAMPNIHYAQELYVMARPGDALLVISTSGNSSNILHTMAVARMLKLPTISLTGPDGGEAAQKADVPIRLPGKRPRLIQESHLPCYHLLCLAIEAAFFPREVDASEPLR